MNDAEDLDIVMPMYNLIEYSKNYSTTTGSLYNYYRDESNSGAVYINYSIRGSKGLIIKQALQEDYKVAIQKKKLRLLCH